MLRDNHTVSDNIPLMMDHHEDYRVQIFVSWEYLPADVWEYMILSGYLNVNEIIKMCMLSRNMLHTFTKILSKQNYAVIRNQVKLYLDDADMASNQRHAASIINSKRTYHRVDLIAAVVISISICSLQMDSFQLSYIMDMKKAVDTIVREGSYSLACYSMDYYNAEFNYRMITSVPAMCYGGFDCTPSRTHVTDGPAGFWFANFIPAIATYAGMRFASSLSFAKRPIVASIATAGAAAIGGLTAVMPLLTSISMTSEAAVKFACCSAFNLAEQYIYNQGACCTYDKTHSFYVCNNLGNYQPHYQDECFVDKFCKENKFTNELTGDTSAAQPLIPVLAAVPSLVYSTLGVAALLGFSIWRKVKSESAEKQHLPAAAIALRNKLN